MAKGASFTAIFEVVCITYEQKLHILFSTMFSSACLDCTTYTSCDGSERLLSWKDQTILGAIEILCLLRTI